MLQGGARELNYYLRSAAGVKGRFQSELLGGHRLPNLASKWTATLDGCVQRFEFRFRRGPIHLE